MSTPADRSLEGPGSRERLDALRSKFRRAGKPTRRRIWAALLAGYWIACLGVIGLGLDRLHPEIRAGAIEALVTRYGAQPYPSCAAAHAAGVYDIPAWSRAYSEQQDGDGDGLACEPPR